MTILTTAVSDPAPAPFLLEHRYKERRGATFTPEAAVLVTPALCASGLLAALDGEGVQTLLGVLACVTDNGSFIATPEQLSPAFGISPAAVLERLRHLSAITWRETPLLTEMPTESGLRLFVPTAKLFEVRHAEPPQKRYEPSSTYTGNREAVMAHSRAVYGRPRTEVEAEIERFLANGLAPDAGVADAELTPEQTKRRRLRRRLVGHGLAPEQAEGLLELHPWERIERQLDWLPYRRVRNPAGFLLAAVENDYAAPAIARKAAPATDVPDAVTPHSTVPSYGIGPELEPAKWRESETARLDEDLTENLATSDVEMELPVPPATNGDEDVG